MLQFIHGNEELINLLEKVIHWNLDILVILLKSNEQDEMNEQKNTNTSKTLH